MNEVKKAMMEFAVQGLSDLMTGERDPRKEALSVMRMLDSIKDASLADLSAAMPIVARPAARGPDGEKNETAELFAAVLRDTVLFAFATQTAKEMEALRKRIAELEQRAPVRGPIPGIKT